MRVMVFGMVNEDSAPGLEATPEMLEAWAAMDKFTEELANAGVMVAGAGLKPTAEGKRIVSDGATRTVIDGPFAEAREIVAGFSIWEVKDMDEAVAWAKRSPNVSAGRSVMSSISPLALALAFTTLGQELVLQVESSALPMVTP